MKTIIVEDRREKLLAYIHESVPCLENISDLELCSMKDYEKLIQIAEEKLKKADPEEINNLYFEWVEPIFREDSAAIKKQKYLLLSSKTDCGNLSIYSFFAENDEEAAKVLNRAVFNTADKFEGVFQVESVGLEGYILYNDEEREDFRVIAADEVPSIENFNT